MKKIILFIVFITLLTLPITVYSEDSFIKVNVEGNIKRGENIDIIIKSENINSIYGVSIGLTYDPELIKINSIIGGEFVSNNENIIEVENEVCKNGNQAGYTFTFIGENEGVSGSFNIATINATILNIGNLKLNEENIDIKIAQRNGDSINEYNCPLVGIDLDIKDDSIKEVIIQTEGEKKDENSIDTQNTYDKEIDNEDEERDFFSNIRENINEGEIDETKESQESNEDNYNKLKTAKNNNTLKYSILFSLVSIFSVFVWFKFFKK